MTRFITSLRYKYIFILVFSLLFCFVSAKDNSNFNYTSIPQNTTISYLDILTEGEIIFNNEGILVISKEKQAILFEAKEKIELQSSNKIVFKPGTKIVPGEGEVLKASITITNIKEERSLKMITNELSSLFYKKDKTKSSFNKKKDKEIYLINSTTTSGLLVDNQQRRIGNSKSISHYFSANIFISKCNFFQTTSGFKPVTVEVLRL